MRKTKIICTIGPSSESYEAIENLIFNGMDIARINTSHCSKEEAKKKIENIRAISMKRKTNTAVILDLQGPKIRVGRLVKDIILEDGQQIILTIRDIFSTANKKNNINSNSSLSKEVIPVIKVNYDKFLDDIRENCIIFIDDGLLEFRIQKINKLDGYADAVVIRGGLLSSNKGINLPGLSVSVNSVTEKDMDFLNFGIEVGVDFIAQSFVRDAEDIKKIKSIIKEKNSHVMVIAKIEKHEAVSNFDSILKQADAIMVARGDLGIEVPQEDVPNIQKEIIKKANMVGKPVITATQMLDSMIRNPRPTRAEVSDVANAILDGSDAVMLSGETAAGGYPVEALKTMVRIINKTEETLDYNEIMQKKFAVKQHTITEAISFAACEIASVLGAKAIITSTQSGSTARQVSKSRPESIIIGTSPHEWVIGQLMITWGVIPAKTKFFGSVDKLIGEAVSVSKKLGYIKKGDIVVITGGIFMNKPGSTNFINVKEIE
ncbi:MAG: pyruvate kinase [Actinobacteria bacterium]|nr:pyruvate kinase [Actinomycetota bacterium]